MRYRKKPVVIEAFQLVDGAVGSSAYPAGTTWPDWAKADVLTVTNSGLIQIATLEGVMTAAPNDWIIQGVKGEIYPCKPDIFTETYEPENASA